MLGTRPFAPDPAVTAVDYATELLREWDGPAEFLLFAEAFADVLAEYRPTSEASRAACTPVLQQLLAAMGSVEPIVLPLLRDGLHVRGDDTHRGDPLRELAQRLRDATTPTPALYANYCIVLGHDVQSGSEHESAAGRHRAALADVGRAIPRNAPQWLQLRTLAELAPALPRDPSERSPESALAETAFLKVMSALRQRDPVIAGAIHKAREGWCTPQQIMNAAAGAYTARARAAESAHPSGESAHRPGESAHHAGPPRAGSTAVTSLPVGKGR
jgi:hypothetical protein